MAETTRVIRFSVRGTKYCIDIDNIDQVVSPSELEDGPGLSDISLGLMRHNDKVVELWDGVELLKSKEASRKEKQEQTNRKIESNFQSIEDLIQRYNSMGNLTNKQAKELSSELTELRETIITGEIADEILLEDKDVIVLSSDFVKEGNRIGILVDVVENISVVSRDQLDQRVGGESIYGVIRDEDDEEDGDEEDKEIIQRKIDEGEITVWVDIVSLYKNNI